MEVQRQIICPLFDNNSRDCVFTCFVSLLFKPLLYWAKMLAVDTISKSKHPLTYSSRSASIYYAGAGIQREDLKSGISFSYEKNNSFSTYFSNSILPAMAAHAYDLWLMPCQRWNRRNTKSQDMRILYIDTTRERPKRPGYTLSNTEEWNGELCKGDTRAMFIHL